MTHKLFYESVKNEVFELFDDLLHMHRLWRILKDQSRSGTMIKCPFLHIFSTKKAHGLYIE